jgi:hypothetical protein
VRQRWVLLHVADPKGSYGKEIRTRGCSKHEDQGRGSVCDRCCLLSKQVFNVVELLGYNAYLTLTPSLTGNPFISRSEPSNGLPIGL